MHRLACAHCGLPVAAPGRGSAEGPVYCCYGCYLVSRIVGRQDGEGVRAWAILRLGVGALLAMDVCMISLVIYTGGIEASAVPVFRWIMLGLATPAMVLLGYPFVCGAAGDLRRGRLSLDALVALGSLAAFGASVAATVRGEGHVYFDTATMLPALVTFGKLIEATAKGRAGRLVRGLETLLPPTALRIEPGGPREVPLADLAPGDRLQVRPGERFPADGCILEGSTIVDEAAFTGESQPRSCGPGDQTIAGTVNGAGAVVIEARHVGEDLLINRIIEMIDEARRRPSSAERIADRAAAAFVPAVLALAVAAGSAWFLAGSAAQAGMVALAVLVVACPCAMGIATALATAQAIGRAAREGVLVRGGDIMERVGRLRVVFFDKTGTVTAGRPVLKAVESYDPEADENDILAWLAALESASEHSLGRALRGEAARRGLPAAVARRVEVVPGMGLRGTVDLGGVTREVTAGAETFVRPDVRDSVDVPAGAPVLDGETVVHVAWDGRPRGRVLLTDTLRPDAADAVRQLHHEGIETVLLSGDRYEAARKVAAQLGIEQIEAPRRPEEKIETIRAARLAGLTVGMVGDGINDAPALAAADVGIALGAGTDLARQAGHVVLVGDRLARIPWLVALSRRTGTIIRQNLWWAFGYNAVALAAAAAGLLHPLLAALAMVVSSLTVLANSLRIQRFPAE